jgi:hypothetical protein
MDYILTQVAKIFIDFHPRNEKRHPFDWFAINNVNFFLLGYPPYVSDLSSVNLDGYSFLRPVTQFGKLTQSQRQNNKRTEAFCDA